MPRLKIKSKATSQSNFSSNNRSLPRGAPPSSPIPHMVPPIATLSPGLNCGETPESLNQSLPLSCVRDEPGTEPWLEKIVFVPIPSPPPSKRGKKSRLRRSSKPVPNTQESARPLQDQENKVPHNPSPTPQVVAKAKTKRGKIQVQKSSRVLRPRVCQPSVGAEQEPPDDSTCPSALQLTQGKEKNETPYWEASWDQWAHTRGTIRRAKI